MIIHNSGISFKKFNRQAWSNLNINKKRYLQGLKKNDFQTSNGCIRFVDGVKNSKEASKLRYDIYQHWDRDKEGNNLYVDATWIIQDGSGHNNENRFVFCSLVKHWKARKDKSPSRDDDFSSPDWRIALFFQIKYEKKKLDWDKILLIENKGYIFFKKWFFEKFDHMILILLKKQLEKC